MSSVYSYCVSADRIVSYGIEKFDGFTLREIEDKAIEMATTCKENKVKYKLLAQELTRLIYELTTDDEEQDKLFAYARNIMSSAVWYSSQK